VANPTNGSWWMRSDPLYWLPALWNYTLRGGQTENVVNGFSSNQPGVSQA
jgi:hypothetical protein